MSDWLKLRTLTIIEALTLRRVIAVPIVIAVITAVVRGYTAITQFFEERGEPWLLGAPPWVYGVFAGFILLIYFIVEYATRLRLSLVPKIELSFNPALEGIVQTPVQVTRQDPGSLLPIVSEHMASYVRIRATALSRTTVRDCSAFLVGLERRSGTGRTTTIALPHGLSLKEHFDVYPKVPCTVDFLTCGSNENKLRLSGYAPFALRDVFDEKATYRFAIVVIGEGIDKTIRVDVDWHGTWDGISGREADNPPSSTIRGPDPT